ALAGGANGVGAFDKRPLMQQYFRERLAAGGGIGHGIEFFVALAVIRLRRAELARGVGEEFLVLEIFADLFQALEILGGVGFLVDDQRPLGFRSLFAAVGVFGEDLNGPAVFSVGGGKLKDGIILELLLDPLLQLLERELEDLQRLNHSRREELPELWTHRLC